MGEAIGNILPLAVAISLSPFPIVGVVLMLASPRARANGLAFLAGWVAGLVVVGTIVVLAAGGAGASDDGEPETWVSILKLLLGAGLVLLAAGQWRKRPRGDAEPPLPKWMQTTDSFKAGKALTLGFALAAVNPKNLLLIVAAGASIAQAGLAGGDQAVVLAVFVAIATLGPGLPVVIYFTAGRRAQDILGDLKGWLAHNNTVIMAVLLLVIGAKLIGDGIAGLSA